MNARLTWLSLTALLLTTAPAMGLAGSLKVGATGGDAQTAKTCICPECGHPMVVSQMGAYTIAFSAESIHPKTGLARFAITVTDPSGNPVTDARVGLVLSMPAHHHGAVTLQATGGERGRYVATTGLSPHMRGQWTAEVKVTPPNGSAVTQSFTFEQ